MTKSEWVIKFASELSDHGRPLKVAVAIALGEYAPGVDPEQAARDWRAVRETKGTPPAKPKRGSK
jgi:hypothetical protein